MNEQPITSIAESVTALQALRARPFHQQVVQSPWHTVVDVPSLHTRIKTILGSVLQDCKDPGAPRCVTIFGDTGYGKTHLLAWLRQEIDTEDSAVFVYVPPYTPEAGPLEYHLLRSMIDALKKRSHRQSELFSQAVRQFLAKTYDRLISDGTDVRALRAGGLWKRLFWKPSLRISEKGKETQLAAIRRAFHRRALLRHGYFDLKESSDGRVADVAVDWDTFVAACLLTCGDTRHRWHAQMWLDREFQPPEVLEQVHLIDSCEGRSKTLNALFTIQQLVAKPFCFAFDQMESTYDSFRQDERLHKRELEQMAVVINTLRTIPALCMVFMFQKNLWIEFAEKSPRHMIDRMVEGYGALGLMPMDDKTAVDLIRRRMDHFAWSKIPNLRPSEENTCFPFSSEEIRRLRIASASELRSFLRQAQARYDEILSLTVQERTSERIKLTCIEPATVSSHEEIPLTILGENIPEAVRVYFEEVEAIDVVCNPDLGQIEVTKPPTEGVEGMIKVTVQSAQDESNKARLALNVVLRSELQRPYSEHVDRALLKHRRRKLNLTQQEVANQLGVSQGLVSRVERGMSNPSDEFFVRIADVLQKPLIDFRKYVQLQIPQVQE